MKKRLLVLLLSPFALTAQEPSLYFEKITVQNGLSHNRVTCILQDKRGFIWMGTDDGLNRYDGKNFLQFRHRTADSGSLSGNLVTDMLEDREGRLWIATADGGLSRYDYRLPPSQQFRQFQNLPANPASLPVNTVNAILQDRNGYLWLGTGGRGVLRFNKQTETFDDVTQSTKTILDLAADGNGTIWVGRQGGGIMRINPKTGALWEDGRYKDLYAKLPHATVTALFTDAVNNVWYGSWDKALYRRHAATGKEEVFQTDGVHSFQADEVLCFAQDRWGRLWMGGKEKGLHVFDAATKKFYNYRYNPAQEGSLADDRVNCLFIDRQGRMWVGTNRGVCINRPDKQQFAQQFLKGKEPGPVTVHDFYEDENGTVWIGTSAGIFLRRPDGTLAQRSVAYKGTPLQVSEFFKDGDGSFYLGTNVSLFKYDAQANAVAALPNTEKDSVMNRLISSRVVSVLRDTIEGRPVLLTSPIGHFLAYYDLRERRWVSRLDPGKKIIERFNLRDNFIRKIYRAKTGSVWMANGREGLGQWTHNPLPRMTFFKHDPQNPSSIANNNVYDMAEDDKGNLWVSTVGGGLHYFDVKKKSFTHIAASHNLSEGLQVDRRQNVWMVSNGNLHKYDPAKKTYTTYHLPDAEKTGGIKGKLFQDRSGRLYAAGLNYFISFHPDSIASAKAEPAVFLTDFQLFNQSFSHRLQEKKITLNYKDNYFAFEFSAPEFSPGNPLRYSYMLEGFDRAWVDAGERNYVSYSNLDGGDYTFKVRATNTPGNWSPHVASVQLTVIPPYWKRPWFYLVCSLLLTAIIYGLYRYRINELLKRQAIRNRIAQDLHDNVGSTLSSISVYSQVAKIYQQQEKGSDLKSTLEKISDASTEMISELNDTVWAINPRNDNMEVLLQRMDSLAKPLLAAQGIQFRLRYDEHLKGLNLEMEKRKNLYSVFKESVNNALKYAGAKKLTVDIRQKGNRLLMRIEDDGKGFDLSKTSEGYKSSDVYGGGNGLKNMQHRAKEMKGNLLMQSEPGKGTSVELSFPVT